MGDYVFRLARLDEKDKILAFMDLNWNCRHPILHHEEYFRFYFQTSDRLNFGLALEENEIAAVCGFIPCSQTGEDIWISLWQAARKKNGAGLELMSRMLELTGAKRMSCNNIREETQVFYQFLGYETGELHQYYRLGFQKNLQIASVSDPVHPLVDSTVRYKEISSFSELESDFLVCGGQNPQKDLWHLKRRFFEFPGYSYHLYGLYDGKNITSLLVVRINPVGTRNVLRIVDFWGSEDQFALIGGTVDELMHKYDAEYTDIYCTGLSELSIKASGFTLRERGSNDIIPNYLNPPVRANTDYFYFTSQKESFRMFKADGDQDRPNLE